MKLTTFKYSVRLKDWDSLEFHCLKPWPCVTIISHYRAQHFLGTGWLFTADREDSHRPKIRFHHTQSRESVSLWVFPAGAHISPRSIHDCGKSVVQKPTPAWKWPHWSSLCDPQAAPLKSHLFLRRETTSCVASESGLLCLGGLLSCPFFWVSWEFCNSPRRECCALEETAIPQPQPNYL